MDFRIDETDDKLSLLDVLLQLTIPAHFAAQRQVMFSSEKQLAMQGTSQNPTSPRGC